MLTPQQVRSEIELWLRIFGIAAPFLAGEHALLLSDGGLVSATPERGVLRVGIENRYSACWLSLWDAA